MDIVAMVCKIWNDMEFRIKNNQFTTIREKIEGMNRLKKYLSLKKIT